MRSDRVAFPGQTGQIVFRLVSRAKPVSKLPTPNFYATHLFTITYEDVDGKIFHFCGFSTCAQCHDFARFQLTASGGLNKLRAGSHLLTTPIMEDLLHEG